MTFLEIYSNTPNFFYMNFIDPIYNIMGFNFNFEIFETEVGFILPTLVCLILFIFLIKFCLSLRIEVSKVRLSFLSFISFFFLVIFLIVGIPTLFTKSSFYDFYTECSNYISYNEIFNQSINEASVTTYRENYFIIFAIFLFVFFMILLFLSFSDFQFIDQSKNFEFIWLLWLFFISSILLILSWNFIEIFICLECISFCSYILISLERFKKLSSTSGIRYLIISSIPSVFLLLGIILLYKKDASYDLFFTNFVDTSISNTQLSWLVNLSESQNSDSIENFLKNNYIFNSLSIFPNNNNIILNYNNDFENFSNYSINSFNNIQITYFYSLVLVSLIFIFSNLFFKLSAAPFHFWAPVIYNNGSLGGVIFLNIFLKIVIFIFFIILNNVFINYFENEISNMIIFFALTSFIFGSIGAISERFIKRFFVYSSMVDVGFILVMFSFYSIEQIKNILLYIVIYNLSSMTIWFFFMCMRNQTKFITNLNNMLNNNLTLKLLFSFVIFSMAGLPPFAGFFIKYNVMKDLLDFEAYMFAMFVFTMTIVSLFYYLRLIKILFFDKARGYQYVNLKNIKFKSILFILTFFILTFFIVILPESLVLIFDSVLSYDKFTI